MTRTEFWIANFSFMLDQVEVYPTPEECILFRTVTVTILPFITHVYSYSRVYEIEILLSKCRKREGDEHESEGLFPILQREDGQWFYLFSIRSSSVQKNWSLPNSMTIPVFSGTGCSLHYSFLPEGEAKSYFIKN